MFAAQDGVTPTSVIYADDVFSTYLYTGDGQLTQTINNGIDLSGKGGLVWGKSRTNVLTHHLFDSARGPTKFLESNNTGAQGTLGNLAFSSTGFTAAGDINALNQSYVSWTFREAPKFFDVVTYTGDGQLTKTVNHNLGTEPAFVIIKRTDSAGDWYVAQVNVGFNNSILLNSSASGSGVRAISNATSTQLLFNNADTQTRTNINGASYVAYLFANDTSSTGLIRCGSYTGNGSATGPTVTLGWEPQWVLTKVFGDTSNWNIFDALRGFTVAGQNDAYLEANTSDVEALADWIAPLATGFQITTTSTEVNKAGFIYIYMAIRRPNKPPTSGAQVFSSLTAISGNGIGTLNKYNGSNSPNDMISMFGSRTAPTTPAWLWADRLRGYPTAGFPILDSTSTAAEATRTSIPYMSIGGGSINYTPSANNLVYRFARAPGFFDEVCYTGTGSNQTVSHNLGAVPELVIVKRRSGGAGNANWCVAYGTSGAYLNDTSAFASYQFAVSMSPSATSFTANSADISASGCTYVTYLFATLPGISKVGTYTGNGTNQTINAGFTAGSRFVMIKRTDSTGDWYVWDSERGIIAGIEPHLSFNSTAAEVTTDNSVDPAGLGFIVYQVAATNINVTSATYIYLAIA